MAKHSKETLAKNELIKQLMQLADDEQFEQAKAQADALLQGSQLNDADKVNVYTMRGYALVALGDPATGEQDFLQAIEYAGNSPKRASIVAKGLFNALGMQKEVKTNNDFYIELKALATKYPDDEAIQLELAGGLFNALRVQKEVNADNAFYIELKAIASKYPDDQAIQLCLAMGELLCSLHGQVPLDDVSQEILIGEGLIGYVVEVGFQEGASLIGEPYFATFIAQIKEVLTDPQALIRMGLPKMSRVDFNYLKKEVTTQDKPLSGLLLEVLFVLATLRVSKRLAGNLHLSHTTRIATAKVLLGKTLGHLRLGLMVHANDPTEGKHLLDVLGAGAPIFRDRLVKDELILFTSFAGAEGPLGEAVQSFDKLPMWSMYSDDAKGAQLVFEAKDLAHWDMGNEALMLGERQNHQKTPLLYKVHYVDDLPKELNDTEDEWVNKALVEIKKHLEALKGDDLKKNLKDAHDYLQHIAYLVKTVAYSYENEYRLLCFEDLGEGSRVEIDEASGRLYRPLDVMGDIKAVIAGAKIDPADKYQLLYRLRKHEAFVGKDVPVPLHESVVPYK